jgi:hypothetical protein
VQFFQIALTKEPRQKLPEGRASQDFTSKELSFRVPNPGTLKGLSMGAPEVPQGDVWMEDQRARRWIREEHGATRRENYHILEGL